MLLYCQCLVNAAYTLRVNDLTERGLSQESWREDSSGVGCRWQSANGSDGKDKTRSAWGIAGSHILGRGGANRKARRGD